MKTLPNVYPTRAAVDGHEGVPAGAAHDDVAEVATSEEGALGDSVREHVRDGNWSKEYGEILCEMSPAELDLYFARLIELVCCEGREH